MKVTVETLETALLRARTILARGYYNVAWLDRILADCAVEQAEADHPVSPAPGFVSAVNAAASEIHSLARRKGWWDQPREDGTIIALIHSELSEALEALRKGVEEDEHCPEYTGVEIELADVVIRILDYADHCGLRLAEAILAKHEYNAGRSYRHGGKEF